jgi:hypothetical protein
VIVKNVIAQASEAYNYVLYSVGLLPCSQTIDLPEKTLQGQTLQLKSGSVSDEANKFYTIDARTTVQCLWSTFSSADRYIWHTIIHTKL